MTSSKVVHFDTIHGVEVYDAVFSNRRFLTGQTTNSGHNYNTRIPISYPISNVKQIELSSLEFPYCTPNVRGENRSNYFEANFRYQGILRQISFDLIPKNYTGIGELILDMNTKIVTAIQDQSALAGFTLVLSLNPLDSSKIILKANCSTAQGGLLFGSCSILKTILTENILGISYEIHSNSDLFIGNTTTGISTMVVTNSYNLQPDNYFNCVIPNLNHGGTTNSQSGVMTSFKIPLNGMYGEVLYQTANTSFLQYLNVNNQTVSEVHFRIFDRWGFPVYGTGAGHVSFTLTFHC